MNLKINFIILNITMGIYYSEDGRSCTSTLDYPVSTYLTDKGVTDTDAAIIIQRWWRRIKKQTSQLYSDTESYMADYSDNSFDCVRKRHSYKRKLDEMTDMGTDSELEVEEINSAELDSVEQKLQIVNNNFLLGYAISFYNFTWKVITSFL
jgi:hypothetical protein